MKAKIVGNNKLSLQEKKKWQEAQIKAHKTGKEAKSFTKYKLHKMGYRYLDFDTKTRNEGTGIVDLVAVKRSTDRDSLEIILFQVKGRRNTKITDKELKEIEIRLKRAAGNVTVDWNIAVKRGSTVSFISE